MKTQQVVVIENQQNPDLDLKACLEALGYSVSTPTDSEQTIYLAAYAGHRHSSPVMNIRNVKIDLLQYRVFVNEKEISLTKKEFGILHCLAVSAGEPVPPLALLEKVWGPRFQHYIQTLRVHIGNLRQKIESVNGIRIEAIRGVGYRLV